MSTRAVCVEILEEILTQKQFFNALKAKVAPQDLAFTNRLILDVLRHYTVIDQILSELILKPLQGKKHILRSVLLCAVGELFGMQSPDYAVLNEYVAIAKRKTDHYAAGMVNAVLRKIVKQQNELKEQFNHPQLPNNFRQILARDYDDTQIRRCEDMLSVMPPLDLSVRSNAPYWAEKLGGLLFANGTIRLNEPNLKVNTLAGFEQGAWWVQDLAASLPVELLEDVRGLKILDLCAAPGGKTAQLLARGALVTAVDIAPERLDILKENITRLKLTQNLTTHAADGLAYLEETHECFDAVVLDAPCSATGTFRRHPEVLHFKTLRDIERQVSVQNRLLEAAAKKLSSNGKLLYCTCAVDRAENEDIIDRFLKTHHDFAIVPLEVDIFNRYDGKKLEKHLLDKGVLRTLPYDERENGGMDAFFAVCLKKTE